MSCLHFASWAAKKAAQLVKESGGGEAGAVKVLDLDAYGITNSIMSLWSSGGGNIELDIDHSTFWEIPRSNSSFAVKFTYTPNFAIHLNCAATTVNDAFGVMAFCGLAIAGGTLLQLDFKISATENFFASGTTMIVTVVPLTATEVTT